ncbi:MAG: phospholipase D family protein [Minwuia sp.]|nr:phospholipase D family protein [Minwuia sp.]
MQSLHFESGHRITPLIEADETFAAMEQAIDAAAHEVFMAYWTLAPYLPLVTDPDDNWIGLLDRAARRGVRFRILLADFDPVFTLAMHRDAWRTFHRLRGIAEADDMVPGAMQAICSRNLARPNLVERLASHLVAQFKLHDIAKRLNGEAGADSEKAHAIHTTCPGLWPHLTFDGTRFRPAFPRPIRPLPGSHHEKICIVDRRIAFVGGLDIGERRYDTADHEDESPWHDLACRVEGPAVGRLTDHFIARWNTECQDYEAYVAALPRREGHESIRLDGLEALEQSTPGPSDTAAGDGEVAVASSPVRPSDADDRSRCEIASAVEQVIHAATRFIYVENQFLREARVVDWIIEAASRHPDLEVIILLPIAPERMDPDGEWNPASRHGHWLQLCNVQRLREALADRFGVFTLLSRQKEQQDDDAEDIGLGARSVYVHAKAIIADDRIAMIGSANLNGRSFMLDTETALIWREPDGVRQFRERLWRHHLDDLLPDDFDPMQQSGLTLWNLSSARNRVARTTNRPGFAVAFEQDWAARHAKRSRFVRNRFV